MGQCKRTLFLVTLGKLTVKDGLKMVELCMKDLVSGCQHRSYRYYRGNFQPLICVHLPLKLGARR